MLSGLTGLYAGASHLVRQRERLTRQMRNDPESCYEKVQRYLSGHLATIFNKIRMTAAAFRLLTSILEERQLLQASNQACIEEKIMITLEILAQATSNREAQEHWNRSAETISRWFSEVLHALCMLKDEFIKPPNYTRVQKFIRDNHKKYRSWFNVSVSTFYMHAYYPNVGHISLS